MIACDSPLKDLQFALEGIPAGINIDVSSQEVRSHFFYIVGQRYQNFTDLLAFGSVINQLRDHFDRAGIAFLICHACLTKSRHIAGNGILVNGFAVCNGILAYIGSHLAPAAIGNTGAAPKSVVVISNEIQVKAVNIRNIVAHVNLGILHIIPIDAIFSVALHDAKILGGHQVAKTESGFRFLAIRRNDESGLSNTLLESCGRIAVRSNQRQYVSIFIAGRIVHINHRHGVIHNREQRCFGNIGKRIQLIAIHGQGFCGNQSILDHIADVLQTFLAAMVERSFYPEIAVSTPQAASIMEVLNQTPDLAGQILKNLLLQTAYAQPNTTVTG